VVTARVCVLSQ